MMLALPTTAAEITPAWLTDALQAAGLAGVVVSSATLTRIGQDEGFTGGRLYRIGLTYRGMPDRAPMSLVAKLSPSDPVMAAHVYAANCREVMLYTRMVGTTDLAVPRCYFGAADPDGHASLLLLQDLAGARSVPFATGLSTTDAAAVTDALAKIHANWWQSPRLQDLSGMALLDEFGFSRCWARYPDKVADLLGGIEIPATFLDLGDHLVAHQAQVYGDLLERGPLTCLHRDIHADNVMFGAQGEAILLDWQIMGKGRGTYDIGYLLISSLSPDTRLASERNLVLGYHAALEGYGVTEYAADQCWQDYLKSVVGKFFVTVVATVILDNASPHKIAWRKTDLERLLAFCADHQISAKSFG